MKRTIVFLALAGMLMINGAAIAAPNDAYDDSQSHPLRVAAYLVNPVGVALEWVIYRPIHWVVSRESLETVFGHRTHGQEVGSEEYGSL